jgi:hypothetical protein
VAAKEELPDDREREDGGVMARTYIAVICPYCGEKADLVDSKEVYGKSYGLIWLCRPCDAYVGTHRNSADHMPLGNLANKELREARKEAHKVFDRLWKQEGATRNQAYSVLAALLNIPKKKAHIGMFSLHQCQKLMKRLCEGACPFQGVGKKLVCMRQSKRCTNCRTSGRNCND